MKTFCILILTALLQLNNAIPTHPVGRPALIVDPFILNGQEAKIGEFPHQLMLERGRNGMYSLTCGAVIISKNQAITAAHCVHKVAASQYQLVAGRHYATQIKDVQIVKISKIVTHPKYNDETATFSNDIAVLNFAEPLKFNDKVGAIVWNDDNNNTFAGKKCVLSGWGKTTSSFPSSLQRVTVDIISNKECQPKFNDIAGVKIYNGHVCAFTPRKGSCNGDSGGPMTCQHKGKAILAGVTSWGVGSMFGCSLSHPSVYARTSHFRQFILDNLV